MFRALLPGIIAFRTFNVPTPPMIGDTPSASGHIDPHFVWGRPLVAHCNIPVKECPLLNYLLSRGGHGNPLQTVRLLSRAINDRPYISSGFFRGRSLIAPYIPSGFFRRRSLIAPTNRQVSFAGDPMIAPTYLIPHLLQTSDQRSPPTLYTGRHVHFNPCRGAGFPCAHLYRLLQCLSISKNVSQ